MVASCTTSFAVCPVGPMCAVPCTLVPTRTTHTTTRLVAATTNHGSVCFGPRRRSIDWSEATNLPTWSPANLGPGEIHFRETYCSHWLLFFFFADLERRSVADTAKGHQQTWGQVSPRFEIRSTHIPLLLLYFADLERRSVAASTKGHQQTWGQVSASITIHCTHSLLSLFQAPLARSTRRYVVRLYVCLRPRSRTMVPPMCLCVSSPHGSVHIHPCVCLLYRRVGPSMAPSMSLCAFVCIFVPWFRPYPSMRLPFVSSCWSSHGPIHVVVCVCVYLRPMVPSISIHAFAFCVVLVLPWLHSSSSSSYSYHGPAQVSFTRLCVRLRPMVPSMSIHVCVSCVVVLVSPWLSSMSMCVYLRPSSYSYLYSYHGPAQVSFASLCVRLRPMVPSMFIHVCVACVVVLVLAWFRPCLCVYIFVLVRTRTCACTMVPPNCRLCGFACVCVPWSRPCPAMFIHVCASCVVVLVFPWLRPCLCVCIFVFVLVVVLSSYSNHGPAQVSFARLGVRLRPMVPSMSIHVCASCVVVLVFAWLRPCLCACIFVLVLVVILVPWSRPGVVCESLRVSSSHGSVHVHPCVCFWCRRAGLSMASSIYVYVCVSSSSFSYHGSTHVFVCVCVCLCPMVPSKFIHV